MDYILLEDGPDGEVNVFANPERLICAWSIDDVPKALQDMEDERSAGKWLAGFASYELGYALETKLEGLMPSKRLSPLLCFGVFSGPDNNTKQKLESQAIKEKEYAELDHPVALWSENDYEAPFNIITNYILSGDFYQTNLTFPMASKFKGTVLGLYERLKTFQPVKYGGVVHFSEGPAIISRSPE